MFYLILTRTLKDHWLGLTILSAFMFVLQLYSVLIFPMMSDMSDLNALMADPHIQAMIGKGGDLNTFEGYMSLKPFAFLGMVVAGYVAWLTATFLAGEIEQKSMELLLAQPIRRESLVLWKYAALLPVIVLLALVALLGIFLGVTLGNVAASLQWILWSLVYLVLFGMAFGAMSLLVSALLSDGRQAAIVSLVVMIVSYFVETVGGAVPSLDWIRYVSVFHYFSYTSILVGHDVSLANAIVLVAVTTVFTGLAMLVFQHRDINVA